MADNIRFGRPEATREVEVGPPEELLAAGGRFADLYERWLAGAA